ncbi:hypothetical protein HYFRA_00001895 [Hymenoscyphus fraxineus]|uniref:Uncharacterized protein n=1 Tax=Hymenoscyphus fraxineus TaxID=746836 RepID=A0A9N9PMK0_9HELO|nr:hypothetical protein HYFRA_00001895 [Hymenoscyphus fraxineus]
MPWVCGRSLSLLLSHDQLCRSWACGIAYEYSLAALFLRTQHPPGYRGWRGKVKQKLFMPAASKRHWSIEEREDPVWERFGEARIPAKPTTVAHRVNALRACEPAWCLSLCRILRMRRRRRTSIERALSALWHSPQAPILCSQRRSSQRAMDFFTDIRYV